jgi:hypothetical protein
MNINATMTELMQHVQQMDCRTAYENMCRAQDEIERLKRQLDEMGGEEGCVDDDDDDDDADDDVSNDTVVVGTSASHHLETTDDSTTNGPVSTQDENRKLSSKIDASPKEPTEMKYDTNIMKRAHGSWLHEGGKCAIEYLPNIKCYHITLTTTTSTSTTHQSGAPIIPKRNDVHFNMSPLPKERQSNYSHSSQTIVFYEMRLVHSSSSSSTPLLTLILPACQPHKHHDGPTANISTDDHSISLRIYLQLIDNSSSSVDLMDNLLGSMEGSIFSPITTPVAFINHLSCRNCHSPIINKTNNNNTKNKNNSTIQSVLPLPSGYWDDIEDYLICYDGQANVNFNTSTMNAIRHVALEDDAVLVLHKEDIIEGGCGSGGVCTTRDNVKGYGEHSAVLLGRRRKDNGASEMIPTASSSSSSSQLWQDKSAMKGNKGNTVTCSKCCSTLGFVSGHDLNTLRLYKHLLHCGNPPPPSSLSSSSLKDDTKNVFSKYTCASFLAREMVRYAENEAIYTFIVGVSDENDWTRLGSSMKKSCECVLLHMLSWDSALVGVDGGKMSGGDVIRFEKVLKVIFDITTDRGQHSSGQEDDNDGTNKWTWGGIDLCCPPSMGDDNNEDEDVSQTAVAMSQRQQTNNNNNNKATSVRIYLSTQEYSELKSRLTTGSEYFSEVVKDAIVMSKLGMPTVGNRIHSASLSYLPLVN